MVSSTTKKVGLGAKKVGSGGGGLGLGAKKLNAKVDDRLFDQAPGEDVPVNTTSSSNPVSPRSGGVSPRDSSGHVALPPKSNRFAYSEDGFGNASTKNETTTNRNEDGPKYTMGGLESVPMNSRRGASGHVTLDRNAGKKTNIDTRNFGGGSNASSSASRPPSGNNNSSRSAFGASPKYGNSESGGGFGRNASSSASTSTNPAAAGAANDNYYNATERFAGAKSISSDAFGSGGGSGNRTNNNDDGFGWDANRYAGESGFGSSDIRRGATSPRGDDLDLSASDLMEKISFQAKQDAAAFKNAASRGISGLKNMASSIFDELNR
jgi:ADP-ribosylation factor GTPase-activating protein 2/3